MTKNLFDSIEAHDKLRRERLNEALAKQEKKIRETNVATQAQYTNLESEEYSDNDNEPFNLSSDDDLYIEENSHELNEPNESDSDTKSDEFKNHIGDIQNINNWRYLVSQWIELVENEENNELEEINDNADLVDDTDTILSSYNEEAKWKLSNFI
ncbi:10081_t:CDS:2 [Dentiscutata erythropus]|uniref:10081_t:CDS:1 n=1 Tax=Dentiscutata erythropus TaxID=1348616 RepID=A0A9N8W1A6_9GLOM|nr:10081_t:CDS:2 [Dentiscutata erythropus]